MYCCVSQCNVIFEQLKRLEGGRNIYFDACMKPKSDCIPPNETIQFIKPDKLVSQILRCLFESKMNVEETEA